MRVNLCLLTMCTTDAGISIVHRVKRSPPVYTVLGTDKCLLLPVNIITSSLKLTFFVVRGQIDIVNILLLLVEVGYL